MEAIDGFLRANALIGILRANLGQEISAQVLTGVPVRDLENGSDPEKFVARLPEKVREKVRTDLVLTLPDMDSDKRVSMNTWF